MRPAVGVLLASGLAACAAASGGGVSDAVPDACVVVPRSTAAAPGGHDSTDDDSRRADAPSSRSPAVVIGVPGSADPAHAPVPRGAAERVVFAQLYRPVVRVTCVGRVVPAVAASWHADHDGRQWTFTLRPEARDWSGEPVTATDVASSWLAAQDRARGRSADPGPRFASVDVLDRRTLRVDLTEPVGLGFFARPELAVRTSTTPAGWPRGSGRYRPGTDPPANGVHAGRLTLASRTGGPDVEFRTVAGDARNALDTGVDLLVTDDPDVIEYAATSDGFRTVPLAWDRRYLLLARRAAAPPDTAGVTYDGPIVRPSETALAALARDAVRVRARAAGGREGPDACEDTATRREPYARDRGGAGTSPRILYPADDPVARALAERVVALALEPRRPDARWVAEAVPGWARSGGPKRAVGLPGPAFAEALRSGDDAAYIYPAALSAASGGCAVVAAALRHAPWIGSALPTRAESRPDSMPRSIRESAAGPVSDPARSRAAIVPLIDTGRTLIIRRGIGGIGIDGRGTLLLDGLRRGATDGSRSPTPGGAS